MACRDVGKLLFSKPWSIKGQLLIPEHQGVVNLQQGSETVHYRRQQEGGDLDMDLDEGKMSHLFIVHR